MTSATIEQTEQDILAFEISDEALEAAAGTEQAANYTLAACSGLSVCPAWAVFRLLTYGAALVGGLFISAMIDDRLRPLVAVAEPPLANPDGWVSGMVSFHSPCLLSRH
jgi:hypothetical protein